MKNEYQATLEYLYAQLPMYQRIGASAFKKDLTNIRKLCRAFEHPHSQYPSIHIAGTNGKGSVAHILSAVLQSAGLKTGLYTSPHYCDFRERIKVDGAFVPAEWIVDFVKKNRDLLETIRPSFFEITVAMAFLYFSEQGVDVAVVETGLGGRLDSTNILLPVLSIITNIGYDHQAILGDTLELIAGEKAGIIKKGVSVVIGETHPETQAVFDQKAGSTNSPIVYADRRYRLEIVKRDSFYTFYNVYREKTIVWKNLKVNLRGHYQSANLATVFQALELINDRHLLPREIGEESIRNGLSELQRLTRFMGRWQKIGDEPLIICDSAHNEGGLRQIFSQLADMDFRRLHFVLGMVNDKSLDTVLPLFPAEAVYYFCKADIPRGLDAKQLKKAAATHGLQGRRYGSVSKAMQAARRHAAADDLIFVGGSIFVVGEVLCEYDKRTKDSH